jgi:hypothetical protein
MRLVIRHLDDPAMLASLHRVLCKLAHRGEHVLHVCYLLGVAIGGGYRYAAVGMLICIGLAAVLHEELWDE